MNFEKNLNKNITDSPENSMDDSVIIELQKILKNREGKKTKFDLEILDTLYLQIVRALLEGKGMRPDINYTMNIPDGHKTSFKLSITEKSVGLPMSADSVKKFLKVKFGIEATAPFFYIEILNHGVQSYFIPLDVTDEYNKLKEEKNKVTNGETKQPIKYELKTLNEIRKKIITQFEFDSDLKEGVNFDMSEPTEDNPNIRFASARDRKRLEKIELKDGSAIFDYFEKKFRTGASVPYFPLHIRVSSNGAFTINMAEEYANLTKKS